MSNSQSLFLFGTTLSLGLSGLMITQVAPAQALSLSFTGAELFNNPNVIFPTSMPVVNGNSIDFGTGGVGGGILLELPLLPALSRGDVTFSIGLDYTPLTSDNDAIIGISDGTNVFTVRRIDNFGGGSDLLSGSFSGSGSLINLQGGSQTQILTGLNPVNLFSFDLTITSDTLSDNFISNYVEGNASATGPFNYLPDAFNIDNALSLVFVRAADSPGIGGNGTDEAYRINSLSVTVEDNPTSVPESSNILGLILLGAGFLFTGIKGKNKEEIKTEQET